MAHKWSAIHALSSPYILSCSKYSKSSTAFFKNCEYLPTDYFQQSLPLLPFPTLHNTVLRYLKSQEAIASESNFQRTKTVSKAFEYGKGSELQEILFSFARQHSETSYISKMWSDMYLMDRRPVALTHNPVLLLKPSARGKIFDNPSVRATNIICSALRFLSSLRSNELRPEILHLNPEKTEKRTFEILMGLLPRSVASRGAHLFKAFPLDMHRFDHLFNSTRIASPDKDIYLVNKNSRHLAVLSKGDFFIFDVIDERGNPISPRKILYNLEFIRRQPARCQSTPKRWSGIGIMTTMDRDTAVLTRDRLESLGNKRNLNLVDSALFTLAFSEEVSTHFSEMLSDLFAGPADSRWFEKSFSLIVNKSGTTAVNFESSWDDGTAILRLIKNVFDDAEFHPDINSDVLGESNAFPAPEVSRLEWLIDDLLYEEVLVPAWRSYEKRRSDIQLNVLELSGLFSNNACRRANVCPDAMMQLALQLAHDKVHCCSAATAELCSTESYKHGRSEFIRSATVETRNFLQMARRNAPLTSSPSSPCELFEAARLCSAKHTQLTLEASMGQGWDRHLFALSHFAETICDKTVNFPPIFNDPEYININRVILSTRRLPSSSALSMAAFPPMEKDGYGITYSLEGENCFVSATTWRSSNYSNGVQFIDAFQMSLRQLTRILNGLS